MSDFSNILSQISPKMQIILRQAQTNCFFTHRLLYILAQK